VSLVAEVLSELQRRGVSVAAEGDTLCLRPRRALDDTLLARVRQAKSEILEALRKRRRTCSADCYEIEPEVWIHRPWTGCTTGKAGADNPQRHVQVECRHCHGEKRCGCIACWRGGPSECVACKGTGQVRRWIQ